MGESKLREEITKKRGEIYTSYLNMSVGEFMTLYQDGEINLEPAFQRLFRWSEYQETDFIESILLGYPIPAVFVLQDESGVWDVIDGVQRLSTIYHFTGILKDTDPLILKKAKIIQNLENKLWKDEVEPDKAFDTATRIDFKRSTIPVIILKANSEPKAKYELFKRLNTGGSHLSPQEIRNALILMLSEDVYNKLEQFSMEEIFQNLINLSENKLTTRIDMEIIIRYLFIHYKGKEIIEIKAEHDERIDDILDDQIRKIICDPDFDVDYELKQLGILIDYLSTNLCEDYGFRVYDDKKHKFKGSFSWFIFEVIIWGYSMIGAKKILERGEWFTSKIKQIKSTGEYYKLKGITNLKTFDRIKEAHNYAIEVFEIE